MNTDRMIFIGISVVTVIILIFILVNSLRSSVSLTPETLLSQATHYKGNQDAKVVLVEFSDYECPFCAQSVATIDSLLELYPDQLKFTLIHFPLAQHRGAVPAARAAEAAALQGKFFEYSNELFINQPNYGQSELEKYASNLNLDLEKFKSDMNSETVIAKVNSDKELGEKIKVASTPTFYLIHDDKVEMINLRQNTDILDAVKNVLGDPTVGTTESTEVNIDLIFANLIDSFNGNVAEEQNVPIKSALQELFSKNNDIDQTKLSLKSVTPKDWSDVSLGCKKEGQLAAQVITPGFEVVFVVDGVEHTYHTDLGTRAITCDEEPAVDLPLIDVVK